MDRTELGNMLKENRKYLGKTQTQCATWCGVSLESWQKWERGLSFPRPDKYEKIKECLGVEIGD